MKHYVKILPEFYEAQASGIKSFEVRFNDRGYSVNDTLILQEWDPVKGYTGRELKRVITYVLAGWGLKDGYCILGTSPSPISKPFPTLQDAESCPAPSTQIK